MRSILLLAVLLAPIPAFAHGLQADAVIQGEEIVLEVFFSDGHTPEGADVTVSLDGQDVASGKTDAQGTYRYRPASYGTYVFSVVEPGLHHARAEVFFGPLSSIAPTESATPTASQDPQQTPPPPPNTTDDGDPPGPPVGAIPWPRIGLGVLIIAGLALLLGATQNKGETPWIGERDDRARVVALVVILAGAGAVESLTGALIALGLAIAVALSLGQRARRLPMRLLPLVAILLPLFVLTPFWHRPLGSELLVAGWAWGPTDAGLLEATRVAARVLALGLLAIGVLDAAPFERTIQALQDLKVPRPLVHTALLTYRYLFVFRADLSRVRHALAARGFRPRPSLSTASTFGAVTGGLLVRSLARTERVEQAMRSRGYTGELASPPAPGLVPADSGLVLGALAVGAALILVDRLGLGALG